MSDLVLVTGGGGFVGGSIIDALVKQGHQVAYTYRSRPGHGTGQAFRLDLQDADMYKKYARKLAYVTTLVHAAAHVPDAGNKPDMWEDFDNTVGNSLHVVRNLLQYLPKLQRIVYVSSCYAENTDSSIGFYGTGKLLTEVAIHRTALLLGASSVALRFPQIYGPGESHGIYINKFIDRSLRNEPINLDARAYAKRDLLFIDDVTAAISWALHLDGQKTVTVSSPQAYSAVEVAQAVVSQIDTAPALNLSPENDYEQSHSDWHFKSDYQKYGFKLQYPLKVGIAKTIKYYKEANV